MPAFEMFGMSATLTATGGAGALERVSGVAAATAGVLALAVLGGRGSPPLGAQPASSARNSPMDRTPLPCMSFLPSLQSTWEGLGPRRRGPDPQLKVCR